MDAVLRKADLTGAQLQGAYLAAADLRQAKLGCTASELKFHIESQKDRDRDRDRERERERDKCANLQGAMLNRARLPGSLLDRAQLQGALLRQADLTGASLFEAHLTGAVLGDARLEGATLDFAELRGANLDYAHLQGASLHFTKLQNASLIWTDLQGAELEYTNFEGAHLDNVMVWRASLGDVNLNKALVEKIEIHPRSSVDFGCAWMKQCDWSSATFSALQDRIEKTISTAELREFALKRVAALDPTRELSAPVRERGDSVWSHAEASSPRRDTYDDALAGELTHIACDDMNGRFIIVAFLNAMMFRFERDSPLPSALASRFLDEKRCRSARGLSEFDKEKLNRVREVGERARLDFDFF